MSSTIRVALVTLILASSAVAQSDWFSFTLSWEDSAKTFADASDLLVDFPGQDPATVVDSRGHLRTGEDGHFYWEKTGRRARFWGVNFTFNADFPPCPDEPRRNGEFPDDRASDKIARRLAKLGVNVVRFHHMDTLVSPSGIWDPHYYPGDTQHLDAGQLKRLDWLIYQLRVNGIYSNLNLKVGRHFGANDGVQFASQFKDPLSYFTGVSHWNSRMIELQQDYADKLLNHRNPYTGMSYAEDPAIAFVEIANEDSLFGNLLNDGGLNYLPNVSGSLPEYYSRELDSMWNKWLVDHYSTRDALEAAWKSKEVVGDTSNRIRNWSFDNGMSDWSVYPIGSAKVSATVQNGAGPDGGAALRIDVTSDGTVWHVQATQNGLAVEKDKTYEFSFFARSSAVADIGIDIMKGADPWTNYGLSKTVQLTTVWQRYTAQFQANTTDAASVRPTFELGAADRTIWLDQIEFRETVPKGLEVGEDPLSATVRRPLRSDLGAYAPQRTADLFRFYAEVDQTYFTGMRSFLKDSLGARALVTGTAAWWTYLGDVATQSKLDYVDAHYYWDHPWWPPGRAWQPTGWQINNTPWINQLDDFSSLASQAVEGKPFTVSEFNEVFPNRYALEGPPLVALIANLQDWDAVYMFDYASNSSDFAAQYTGSFFDHSGNPIKSAQLPICSRIFLERQNASAPDSVRVALNRNELSAGYAKGLVGASAFLESKGLDRRTFLEERLRLSTFDRETPEPINHTLPAGGVATSNGDWNWNRDNTNAAFLRVKGPAVQGAIGFIKGATVDFGDWSFASRNSSPDHMAVLLQSRDGSPLRESRHLLLSVWTEHQNTGMVWNSAQTSVDNRWGSAPAIVRPAQFELILRLPAVGNLTLYPLDPAGNRKTSLSAEGSDGGIHFNIDTGRDRTVWYEIEINNAEDSVTFSTSGPGMTQIYTDPSPADFRDGWIEVQNKSGPQLRPTSLLEYRSRGVLTSMVRMPSSKAVTLARVPVIHDSLIDTALAVLNTEPSPNPISMQLLDADGNPQGNPVTLSALQPGQTQAFFLSQKFSLGDTFSGILELRSPTPFYSLTLRGITNAVGDFSLTPYPPETKSEGPLYFAHLTADSSYSSDILLWNSREEAVTVVLDFFAPDGKPASPLSGRVQEEIKLAPGQLKRTSLERRSAGVFYGYARLTLKSGTALPSSTAVITRWEKNSPASEAGVAGTPSKPEELILVAERPSQRTALALLNPGANAVTVDLELTAIETTTGKPLEATLSLGAGEKRAFFLYEVFSNLPPYLNGLVKVKAEPGIAVLALLGVTNERNEFLISSITDEPGRETLSAGSSAILPRFVTGGGYRTIIYLLPDSIGESGSEGQMRFFSASGAPFPLLLR